MANSTVNKVVLGNETLIDLTPVTVTADKLASGYTALDASGALITGALDPNQGSAYQDADGYVVLDEGESTVPQGTLAITADGSYNVADYAGVTVDVVETYTATISGTGNSTGCWVQVNATGTKYYTDGDTFTYADGDYLYIAYTITSTNSSRVGKVTVNGGIVESMKGSASVSVHYCTITDPRCDMEIEISYGNDTTVNLVVPSTSVASITTNGVASVGEATFASVAVPGMPETDLKKYIERNSSDFTDIDWPDGITTIGSHAFAECTFFNPSSLPNTVTVINTYAFYGCSNLTLTSLPSGVTRINSYAFYNCTKLALASLPNTVTVINSYAFYGCSNLTLTSLPSGVTSIGQYTFYNCTKLALASLPNTVTVINSYAFSGCSNLTLTSLPSSVTSIGQCAFQACTGITSISCDGVITTLSASAFIGATNSPSQLVSASFPNLAITSNLSNVFGSTTAANACQLLEFCDIGNAAGIASSAFANCYSLTKLVIRKTSVAALSATSAFTNTPMRGYDSKTGTVYVPSSLISSYQTATNWKTIYDEGHMTFSAIEGSEYELE